MNRKSNLFLVLLLTAAVTSFTSCKKDDKKDIPVSVSKESISGTYKITMLTYQYSNDPIEDVLAGMDACDRDNTVTFNLNQTYHYADVGMVCSPSSDDDGTWAVPDGSTMHIDGEPFHVDSWDGKILKLSRVSTATNETYKYQFTRQ